jgi:hypothetical protein
MGRAACLSDLDWCRWNYHHEVCFVCFFLKVIHLAAPSLTDFPLPVNTLGGDRRSLGPKLAFSRRKMTT